MEVCISAEGARYDVEAALARFAEDGGFAGYFRADHLMRAGAAEPTAVATDVWVTMAGLARDTQRLRPGSVMTSSTFRHPAHLAIIVAQVDAMSGGRVELGIGAGSSPAEHVALGIPLDSLGTRFDRLEEQLELIVAIWSTPQSQEFEFSGDHYRIEGYPARVEPLQSPSPPNIIGGHGPKRTPQLVARFADEFNIDWVTPEQAPPADEVEGGRHLGQHGGIRVLARDAPEAGWSSPAPPSNILGSHMASEWSDDDMEHRSGPRDELDADGISLFGVPFLESPRKVPMVDIVEHDPVHDVASITGRTITSSFLTFLGGLFLRLHDGWRGYGGKSDA